MESLHVTRIPQNGRGGVTILVTKSNPSDDGNYYPRFLRYGTVPCTRMTYNIGIISNRPNCVCSHINRTVDCDTSEMAEGKWQNDDAGPLLCGELDKIRTDARRMQFLEENGLTAVYAKENEVSEAGYCVGDGPVV